MDHVVTILKFMWHEAIGLVPWFMLAVGLGVLASLLALDILARRAFAGRGAVAIIATTAIGAFSPFCSFTVIPLIRRFLAVGVPLSAVMAFWVASPSMDPEIFGLTAAQLGMPVAVARLLGALALSLAAGFVVLALERRGYLKNVLRPVPAAKAEVPACSSAQPATVGAGAPVEAPSCGSAPVEPEPSCGGEAKAESSCGTVPEVVDDGTPWWPMVQRNFREASVLGVLKDIGKDTVSLGKWFLLALFLDALIVYYVPENAISAIVGAGPFAVLIAAAASVPLYVNGVGAIPIIDGLMMKGMDPAAAVAFLLGGAVTTIPAMIAVRAIVTNRVFLLYLGVSFFGALAIGYIANIWM
ncbi:permease [Actinokineospora sp. 24-640]